MQQQFGQLVSQNVFALTLIYTTRSILPQHYIPSVSPSIHSQHPKNISCSIHLLDRLLYKNIGVSGTFSQTITSAVVYL